MAGRTKYAACAIGVGAALFVLDAAVRRTRRKGLASQLVLITGGSRGFGLSLARKFASLGCRIALCARNEDELKRAEQILADAGCEVFTAVCDISNRDAITEAVGAITRDCGCIDILVNNAGEITVSPFENLEIADFERAMTVMFWGMLHATLAVLPSMKTRGQGRIVNVTSIGGKISVPHLLSYSCAKAAAVAFSNGLRNEVRKFGIEVTTVIPGLMRTGSHVNASFKGNRSAEAAWFGTAASLPMLSLSAERAARLAVDAVCAGKSEKTTGVPAQILSLAHTVLPGLTSEMLGIANSFLPDGNADDLTEPGRDLENRHGSLYCLLTTLGRRAGQRLNQPV